MWVFDGEEVMKCHNGGLEEKTSFSGRRLEEGRRGKSKKGNSSLGLGEKKHCLPGSTQLGL